MEKHEWKKQEKNLYLPKQAPEILTVPRQKFFLLTGKGDPNQEAFAEKVGILYSLSYAVRMMPKQGYTPQGYFEYTVYPLEGLWDLTEAGKQSAALNKDEFLYTIMIRQPDFVTKEVAAKALENVSNKKPHPLIAQVRFDTLEDGLAVQMLHVGSYDTEPQSFTKLNDFLAVNKLERNTLVHREIYLSDPRKVEPAKLKTVLRYMVSPFV